jgi:capsular exopolysaccharide synthesis family protein
MKQTGVSKELDSTNITILDPAVDPLKKYRPRRALNILLAFFVSSILGGVAGVVRESLTETIRDADDLPGELEVPFLGYIPHRHKPTFGKAPAIANQDDFATSEAFRTALAVLSLQPESSSASCFIVTSATPSEGKTTCAMNLAACFADKGFRTLLIEADLRRPMIGKNLGLMQVGGLELLVDPQFAGAQIIQETSIPQLHAVATLQPPANPHVLLSMPVIHNFILWAKQEYHRVIIDTPPIGAVSDALPLCSLADGVVWVVRFDTVRKKVITQAYSRLNRVQAKIFGFIINDVNFSSHHNKYYYSYHGYDSYYHKKPVAVGS